MRGKSNGLGTNVSFVDVYTSYQCMTVCMYAPIYILLQYVCIYINKQTLLILYLCCCELVGTFILILNRCLFKRFLSL